MFVLEPHSNSPFSRDVLFGHKDHRVSKHGDSRHDDRVRMFFHHNRHVGKHPRFDGQTRVLAHHLHRERLAGRVSTRIHPRNLAVESPAGTRRNFQVGLLAFPYQPHLRRRHLDRHLHPGWIDDGEHTAASSGQTHHRVDHVAFFVPLSGHHPIKRRFHDRHVELVLGQMEGRQCLLKLSPG